MITLTPSQYEELKRFKQYFPFRIVFGVIDKDTGKFEVYTKTTMHTANRLCREGHAIFLYK
jgi:hypothetical protein